MNVSPARAEGRGELPAVSAVTDLSAVQTADGRGAIEELAHTARAHGFVSAHALPNWVPLLTSLLNTTPTLVGSPVGFPSGGATTRTKLAEASELLAMNVGELDVMLNVGRLRSGDLAYVEEEMTAIVREVAGAVPLRAILEVSVLERSEIRVACELAIETGFTYVKTGTGWTGAPTSLDTVRFITQCVGNRILVKASGGIRDLTTMRAMWDLGVSRFGINLHTALALVVEQATDERKDKVVP